MSTTYTTIDDVISLWRPLTPEEVDRTTALIPVIEDSLRQYANNRGRDLDELVADGQILLNVLKSVVVAVVGRTLTQPTTGEAFTQMTQSAGGYSISGSPLNAGGGIYIKRSEYAQLGLRGQRFSTIDLYGVEGRRP